MRFALPVLLLLAPLAPAADKPAKGVKSVVVVFDPPEAKPGQTVTLRLTVTLDDGYHTYPLAQPDKAAEGMVNKIEFPKGGAVVFVGEATDAAVGKTKAEPDLGIKELVYLPGKAVYERKAVVLPTAKAGDATVALPKFLLSVCDKDNCFPAKKLNPEAKLTVLDGPAVAVDEKYAAEVEKAGK